MLKNYFTIAWRNITRNKFYAALNVLGLSLGLCACTIIYIIVHHEFSFDRFHPDGNRIYRVIGNLTERNGDKLRFVKLPADLSSYGRAELSGIDAIAGIIPFNAQVTIPAQGRAEKKTFQSRSVETNNLSVAFAQPQYFDIFAYKWLYGSPATALTAPNGVVLTTTKARQYFGNLPFSQIVGKQIIYDDSLNTSVAGIIEPWEANTDLAFTDFISYSSISHSFLSSEINLPSWQEHFMSTWTFIKLSAASTPATMASQLALLVKEHGDPDTRLTLQLQPLKDIHFDSKLIEYDVRTADKTTLQVLILIAFFILILAVVNFINLSTAQAIRRAKEVGMRKVLGGKRSQLILQFLAETFALTSFATLLGLMILKPSFDFFRSFIPADVRFGLLDGNIILYLIISTVITALLAGLYPAWVLSGYPPVSNLQGNHTERFGKTWLLRKSLVVFQFTVSIVFIIGSLVMANQLNYTRKKDLGFNKESILLLNTPGGENISKAGVAANEIRQMSGVARVALQWVPPMTGLGRGRSIRLSQADPKETGVVQIAGNEDFIPLYQIKLIAGRNIQKSDSIKEFVINENLSRLMGCKNAESAIGHTLYWDNKPYPVVGVVKDFHSRSFHEQISPACILNRPDRESTIAIKLESPNKQSAQTKVILAEIEKTWKSFYPHGVFDIGFYDESLLLLYKKDEQTETLVNTAMGIAVLISCLGLLALALFTTQKRAKEISIRKILGASVRDISSMLASDFLVLIIIALLIASPLAWYFMNLWLRGFAYRVSISWWIFVLAGATASMVAVLTVGFQAIKAARTNPVTNLRTE